MAAMHTRDNNVNFQAIRVILDLIEEFSGNRHAHVIIFHDYTVVAGFFTLSLVPRKQKVIIGPKTTIEPKLDGNKSLGRLRPY